MQQLWLVMPMLRPAPEVLPACLDATCAVLRANENSSSRYGAAQHRTVSM